MSKSTRTGVWGLEARGRVRYRALLGSVGLHLLLLAGLAMLYSRHDPSSATSSAIIVVEFVLLEDGDGDGGRVQNADPVADEPELPNASDAAEGSLAQTEADGTATRALSIDSAERVAEVLEDSEVSVVAEVSQETTVEGAPHDSAGTPTLEPPQPLEPLQPHEPPQPHELPLRYGPMPPLREADLVAAGPVPLPDFASFREPEIAALETGEHQMLDDKLAEWSSDADVVTREQLFWEHDGRTYSAKFTRDAAGDSMGMDHMMVEVSTERDGRRWSTEMRMQRLAFSSFAQFVDRWDSNVQIHDDEIDGRFHSNSEILISKSRGVQPIFRGKVTTARRVNTSNSERFVRREEVFLGGLETRVQRIQLPQQFVALNDIGNIAAERVHRFAADADIIFHVDGSFSWAFLKGEMSGHRIRLSDDPHYLLGDKGVSLRVSGIVNGKVLVYAPGDIVIGDDLLYANDPHLDPDSDDFVGLVADRNVVVAESRLTGPGDLTVHAAILAKRRFLVRNYRSRGGNTLHVFGSLASGSLSATEPRFRTRLEFDPRLDDARPPGFPVTDRYEVVEWDGTWTEELRGDPG